MTIWPHYGEKRRTTLSTQQPSSSAKQLITLGEHSFQQTVFFCFPMSPSSHTHWSGKMTRLQGMNIGGRVSVSNLLWHACKHALHEQLRHCNTQKCRILHTLPRSVNDLHTFSTKIRKKNETFIPFSNPFGIPHASSFQPLIIRHPNCHQSHWNEAWSTNHASQLLCLWPFFAQFSGYTSWSKGFVAQRYTYRIMSYRYNIAWLYVNDISSCIQKTDWWIQKQCHSHPEIQKPLNLSNPSPSPSTEPMWPPPTWWLLVAQPPWKCPNSGRVRWCIKHLTMDFSS